MNNIPTPETDAFAIKLKTLCGEKYWVPVDIARKLERERDEALELLASEKTTRNHIIKRSVEVEREREEANEELHKQLVQFDQLFDEAEKIRIERDEAREKIEQQRKEIVRFNGATSHAGGTPLKIALRERDEALNKMADALQEVDLRTLDYDRMKQERDDARKAFVIATDQVVVTQSKLREANKEREAFVIAQQEVITNLILERNKALDKINDLKNILR